MIPPLWLANIFGWIVAHKRALFITLAAVVLFFSVIGIYRGCTRPTPKLDEAEIQKAQKAIAENDRATQIEILAKSDAQEKVADDTIANADRNAVNAMHESRRRWQQASDEEIRQELERRAKE